MVGKSSNKYLEYFRLWFLVLVWGSLDVSNDQTLCFGHVFLFNSYVLYIAPCLLLLTIKFLIFRFGV